MRYTLGQIVGRSANIPFLTVALAPIGKIWMENPGRYPCFAWSGVAPLIWKLV